MRLKLVSGGSMGIRKKHLLVGGVTLALVACFVLYGMLDTLGNPLTSPIQMDSEMVHLESLESRIAKLQEEVRVNAIALKSIQKLMEMTDFESLMSEEKLKKFEFSSDRTAMGICQAEFQNAADVDIQMLDLYERIPFDNIDGGVWKQGWDIEYDSKQWSSEKKLQVFVVPHSHNDPGWLKTFEKYFAEDTRSILDNLVDKLSLDSRRKFIWAEISYLSLWWDRADNMKRKTMKRLLTSGQLEIVTGGWVMPDEANSHYYALLEQLLEGNQWLLNNVGYKPQTGWSIDPFGLSPTMAYLLRNSGFHSMLIQRAHYSVKKQLAEDKQLEFIWRQTWDSSKTSDILCHLMPFYSYDVPHTCGPDPKICCQFDFRRLPGSKVFCPWKIPPQVITDHNVAERAELLLDQYRKKAQLYSTNIVLVPLGDDFRYSQASEWDQQYTNYQRLFDFMDKQSTWHVKAQFGTLSDYFAAVRKEIGSTENLPAPDFFPSLSGDFFTYADRSDHYWSGYYTSRPYYKRMGRLLESYLRSAEILMSLALAQGLIGVDPMMKIVKARRSLGLFQHHDGITGTAKDHVMIDYANKMLLGISDLQHSIQYTAHYLLSPKKVEAESTKPPLYYKVTQQGAVVNEDTLLLTLPQNVVLFNPGEQTREVVVRIRVSTSNIKVLDSKHRPLRSQILPVFLDDVQMQVLSVQYDLAFLVKIPALGLQSLWLHPLDSTGDINAAVLSTLWCPKEFCKPEEVGLFGKVHLWEDDIVLSNHHIAAHFGKFGLLTSMQVASLNNTPVPVRLSFVKYGAKSGQEMSGAYLFLPDGEAVPLSKETIHGQRAVQGPVVSFVESNMPNVHQRTTLYKSAGVQGMGLEITNMIDLREGRNVELAMRVSTSLNSGENFFTDVNGWDLLRRKRFSKLPLQAHFYPMPTTSLIEDKKWRLTVLTASPLGTASLASGSLEIMQDRRLNQDDNRGLQQGVLDNRQTPNSFRLILEYKNDCTESKSPRNLLSQTVQASLQEHLHPTLVMLAAEKLSNTQVHSYSPMDHSFPSDMQIVTMFPMVNANMRSVGTVGFIVRHLPIPCCVGLLPSTDSRPTGGKLQFSEIFPSTFGSKVLVTNLALNSTGLWTPKEKLIQIHPMELAAIILKLY